MRQKPLTILTLFGGAMAGMLLGLTAVRLSPQVRAAPAAVTRVPAAKAAGSGSMMDLFTGKAYPLTLKAEQIDTSFRLVALVDAQGKASLDATRGETVSAGGETYLVCYEVAVTDPKTSVPQPKAGTMAHVIYINLHAIQAMGGVIPISAAPPDTPPADTPPADKAVPPTAAP